MSEERVTAWAAIAFALALAAACPAARTCGCERVADALERVSSAAQAGAEAFAASLKEHAP